MKTILAIALAFILTGCGSLLPKPVEFGQKKVQKFPEHREAQKEAERQAVKLAAEKAREAEKIATADESAASLPAGESAELSEAVGRSIGPPASTWTGEVTKLTERLDKLTAKYNRLLEKFADKNDEVAGKKIEGTGFLQIPYFLWLGIVFTVLAVIYLVLKTVVNVAAAGNPAVAVGLKTAQVGGRLLSRGFSQVVKGGEDFKNWVGKEVSDSDLKNKILEQFASAHRETQDGDVQNLVKELTK